MTGIRVAVVQDGAVRAVDPEQPVFSAFDLGPTRGDGVFESLLVQGGVVHKQLAHLDRLDRSARLMDLPGPSREQWEELLRVLTEDGADGDAVLKLLLTRGVDGQSAFSAVGTRAPLPAEIGRQRRDGIRVLTLTLGLPANLRGCSPWLLGGVKYLSYAVNMAAQRHARANGADDAVFVSLDGQVLEGPTSTVVWAGDGVLRTPPTATGILPGTTQQLLFRAAAERGWRTETGPATVAGLHAADGVWLVSSVRGAAEVTALDGVRRRTDPGLTARIAALTGIG